MNIDEEKVASLVSQIRESLNSLYNLKNLSLHEFLEDIHKKSSAKYNFIIAIEAAVDLCNHAISRFGLRAPKDYADSFKVLAEAGAFENEFLKKLMNMARFRNLLVHLYFQVGDKKVYEILQNNLGDLERFIDAYGKFIKK
jgi:uncharacterized protein YutE (UPF0331/DUF86 family)